MSKVCAILLGWATVAAPCVGQAEIVALAPHEKTFASLGGMRFTVGNRDEQINRIPPLNIVGTTREALVSNTTYARIDGSATGLLKVGYHVGCAVNLQNGIVGITPSLPLDADATDGITPWNVGPVATASLAPGKVIDIPITEKHLTSGITVHTITRDFHIVINGCTGPVTVRQYTRLHVNSPTVDDSGTIFGDSTWL